MRALLLACVDGRLEDSLRDLVARLGPGPVDRVQVPGGPLACLHSEHERVSILEWLELVVPAHGIDTIALVSHEDCLAYRRKLSGLAGMPERDVLRRDLLAVKGLLEGRLRTARVDCYVMPLEVVGAGAVPADHVFGPAEPVA